LPSTALRGALPLQKPLELIFHVCNRHSQDEYEGYCLLVLDDQGEIVLTLTSPSKTRKFEETYASVKEGDLVDKKMKTIGEAAASRVR